MERIIAFSASTSSGRARPGRTMASSIAQNRPYSQPFQPHESSCRRLVSARRQRPPDPGRTDLFPVQPGQKRHQLGVVETHARGRYTWPAEAVGSTSPPARTTASPMAISTVSLPTASKRVNFAGLLAASVSGATMPTKAPYDVRHRAARGPARESEQAPTRWIPERTPGCGDIIMLERERIKRETIKQRRLLHREAAA